MTLFKEMYELNETLNLNIDHMTLPGNNDMQSCEPVLRTKQPIVVLERREINTYLKQIDNSNCIAIRLDIAKEIDIANLDRIQIVTILKSILEHTTKYIETLKKSYTDMNIIICVDNFDILIKELYKEGLFLVKETKESTEQLMRDIFKLFISELQHLCRVIMITSLKQIDDFVGEDEALKRRLNHRI